MATRVCFIDIPPQKDSSNEMLDCANVLQQRHHHGIIKERRSLSPMSPVHSSPRYERNMGFFHQLSRRFGLRSNDDLIYTAGEDDSHSSSTDSCSSTTGTLQAIVQQQQQQQTTTTSLSRSTAATANINSKDALTLQQQQLGSSLEQLSCASSDTSSTLDINDEQIIGNTATSVRTAERKLSTASKSSTRSSFSRLHRRSTSSIRRAFESFSISSRSLSCSGETPPQKEGSCSGSPAKSGMKTVSSLELHKKTKAVTNSGANKSKTHQPPQRILRQPVSYTYLKGMSGLPTQRVPRNAVYSSYVRR